MSDPLQDSPLSIGELVTLTVQFADGHSAVMPLARVASWKVDMTNFSRTTTIEFDCDREAVQRNFFDYLFGDDVSTSAPANDRFPHKCPRCGGPAYIGATQVDCEQKCGERP